MGKFRQFNVGCLLLLSGMGSSAAPLDLELGGDGDNAVWHMPRTEYGHPDFQGTWFFGSRTPMQRPVHLGLKQSYTPDEVAALEQSMRSNLDEWDQPLDPQRSAPDAGAPIRQEADDAFLGHYIAPTLVPVNGEYRTSVIYDPADGRVPLREGFSDFHARQRAMGLAETDGPEGQTLSGRCLMFGPVLPSLTPVMMNPNLQLVQTEDYVVIVTEMIHDARIIRLNDTHLNDGIDRWMGDSVGYWDNDTLVIQSKEFRPEQSHPMFLIHSDELEITERYTLVSDNEIHYAFTATDPKAYTQAISGERIITRNAPHEHVYEYGCHEGNLSLPGILAGARRLEADAKLNPDMQHTPQPETMEHMLQHHSTLGAPVH